MPPSTVHFNTPTLTPVFPATDPVAAKIRPAAMIKTEMRLLIMILVLPGARLRQTSWRISRSIRFVVTNFVQR